MFYRLYKLSFTTPVHFGTGLLNESAISFCADTLFSALYIEALKLDLSDELYQAVKQGKLLISDAFPYKNNQYFLPKPMVYIKPKAQGDSSVKKLYKKLKYVSVNDMECFMSGTLNPAAGNLQTFGKQYSQVMASVRREEEDALPYRVGNFLFNENCGLYVIASIADEDTRYLLEDIFDSLSYAGIGGKKSCGKGRFEYKYGVMDEKLLAMLDKKSDRYMLLSSALPKENELEAAMEKACYLVQKRSGFVYSPNYAEEETKKRDLYTFQAGSCFMIPFEGDVYDVNEDGNHPVYRYAKGMFLGV